MAMPAGNPGASKGEGLQRGDHAPGLWVSFGARGLASGQGRALEAQARGQGTGGSQVAMGDGRVACFQPTQSVCPSPGGHGHSGHLPLCPRKPVSLPSLSALIPHLQKLPWASGLSWPGVRGQAVGT